MAVQNKIEYGGLKDLYLDPSNPRLGRQNTQRHLSQDTVLEMMNDWSLEELALSFLESGFWPQEALLVVEELLGGQKRHVVVEGNRRLAALKMLKQALDGKPDSKVWREMVAHRKPSPALFTDIPYIRVTSRKDVVAFLGFRHVTGIPSQRLAGGRSPEERLRAIVSHRDRQLEIEAGIHLEASGTLYFLPAALVCGALQDVVRRIWS